MTRTGAEGQALTNRLSDLGWAALHLPLVRLRGVAEPERIRQQFAALPRPDGLILTSREGVRQAAALGLLESLQDTLTVVPGQGTRSLALGSGLQRVSCPDSAAGNSEAMLAMVELQDVARTLWLILAASDGRRLLDRTLEARGAEVRRLTVYRRMPEPPDGAAIQALQAGQRWITLVASGSALDRLACSLPESLWDKLCRGTMVVPSGRLRARAGKLGASRVIVSAGAGDQDMLEALQGSTSGA